MKIEQHDLSGDEIAEFLSEHIRQMREVTPLESKHALDLDSLRTSDITFWVIRNDAGNIVGTGAIKDLGDGHGEVKSMRTRQDLKRMGIASKLLRHMISYARQAGLTQLSLETGSTDFFKPARQLYEKHGFYSCGPFGSYSQDENSAYYTLKF